MPERARPGAASVTERSLADAAEALAAEAMSPRSLERISTLVSPRAAFRALLEDGRTVKVRCMRDRRRAWRGAWLRAGIAEAALPRVLSRRGRVLLEEWVPGEPWARDDAALDVQIEALAPVLGRLHALEAVRGRRVRSERPTRRWARQAEKRLARLGEAGAVDGACLEALRAGLRRSDPETATVGVIHGDFCLENVVREASGRIHVIDNEDVRIDALDLDLGLAWYRWPMPEAAFERFLDAYARHAGRRPGDLTFWKIAGVVKGAYVRVTYAPPTAPVALDRLRALAGALAPGGE